MGHAQDLHQRSSLGSPVTLNVYHLNDGWEQSNKISTNIFGIGGAFHAGVEVHGLEWTFGCEEGISCGLPRSQEVHVYHESILLGETPLSAQEVQQVIQEMRQSWIKQDYEMLENNCCNFAEALSQELVGEPIPAWVARFPTMISQAAFHLDNIIDVKKIVQDMTVGEQSPVSSPAKVDLMHVQSLPQAQLPSHSRATRPSRMRAATC
jgi:hypothetical protein